MPESYDELLVERNRLRDRVAELEECMRMAGLAAFMRGKPPREIAAHLQDVVQSYVDATKTAEARVAELDLFKLQAIARIQDLKGQCESWQASVGIEDDLDKITVERAMAFWRDKDARVAELESRLGSPGFDRFMAENGDGDRDVYRTLSEAREYADQAIVDWREDAISDGKWSSCVEGVTVWVAIERASEVLVEKMYLDDADSSDFTLKPLPGGEGESDEKVEILPDGRAVVDSEMTRLRTRVAEFETSMATKDAVAAKAIQAGEARVAELEAAIELGYQWFRHEPRRREDGKDPIRHEVDELRSGLHEIAASLPVHESKDLDADSVDDVCCAVKAAMRRYADKIEQMQMNADQRGEGEPDA